MVRAQKVEVKVEEESIQQINKAVLLLNWKKIQKLKINQKLRKEKKIIQSQRGNLKEDQIAILKETLKTNQKVIQKAIPKENLIKSQKERLRRD